MEITGVGGMPLLSAQVTRLVVGIYNKSVLDEQVLCVVCLSCSNSLK
jgi:hypothetical protein